VSRVNLARYRMEKAEEILEDADYFVLGPNKCWLDIVKEPYL